jgi:hypothetical protein
MKKFMLLHFGFEKPTPEIMEAWQAWFASIADSQVDQGGFRAGREISKNGTKDLHGVDYGRRRKSRKAIHLLRASESTN